MKKFSFYLRSADPDVALIMSRLCLNRGLAHSINKVIDSSFGWNACHAASENHFETRSHLKTTSQSTMLLNTICWISGGNSSNGSISCVLLLFELLWSSLVLLDLFFFSFSFLFRLFLNDGPSSINRYILAYNYDMP